MCCIEIAGAVYKERHNTVFSHSTYGQVVFGVQCVGLNGVYINVFIQLNFNIGTIISDVNVLVTAEVNSFTGSYFRCFAAVSGQIPALVCIICYFTNFLQLFFGCSLTFAVSKAIISSSFIAKSAYGCSIAIHKNIACCYTTCCYSAACPDSTSAAADAYKSVRIISCKSNIVIQSNIVFLATVFIEAFGYSNIITIGNSTVLACFCFYILQLAYIYSVGIFSAFCNIDNLTVSIIAAYGYCISSVSYAAGTQSNTAFTGNFGIMTENNSVINSCFGYFISRAENNVILTAYFLIITDNLIAVCGNFIFNTDYSNIRCIGNSVLITVNKVIFCSLSFSTGYFIFYAGQLGVFSVISLVATADCHYRTTCIIAGLHGFNSFFLCFRNRNIIPVGVNADFFNGVGNFVAGTPD